MRFIKSLFKWIGLIVLASIALSAFLLYRGGATREISDHFAGRCERVELDGSAEDIQIDRQRGFAYLSLLDRQSLVDGSGAQGTIAKVDLNSRQRLVESALVSAPKHFRPHGISLYIDASGKRSMFVLNHPVDRGTDPELVEHFQETSPGKFAHIETISNQLFNSPNDLVAVGPVQFYVVNDKVMQGPWQTAAQQFGFGFSSLVYVDGPDARVVASDIASGGGINVSADRSKLYVAETSGMRIRVFDRDTSTGDVTEAGRIDVDTSPDNIDVAMDGSLWVGAHANTLALIRHFTSKTPAPSQVLRVEPRGGSSANIEEIYLNGGTEISASSVGVSYGKKLLIGSITERRILICERDT